MFEKGDEVHLQGFNGVVVWASDAFWGEGSLALVNWGMGVISCHLSVDLDFGHAVKKVVNK